MVPFDEFRLRSRRRVNQSVTALGQPVDPLWPMVFSLLGATVLTVYPVAYSWVGWRPLWLVAVALFWVLFQPQWCGVWFAFWVGLVADLLLDLQLGGQSLALVLVVFVLRAAISNRRVLTFANGWMLAALALAGFLLVHGVMQNFGGRPWRLSDWGSGVVTVLLWPLIHAGLSRWRA